MIFPGEKGFKYIDEEEKDLIEGIEAQADDLEPLLKSEQDRILARFQKASREGRKSVTLRIEGNDLKALRRLSEREGMPYQTLLGSIIHKYVTGSLVDLNEAMKVIKARELTRDR
jgi:predicted DNA binding CopG/RHH family protein